MFSHLLLSRVPKRKNNFCVIRYYVKIVNSNSKHLGLFPIASAAAACAEVDARLPLPVSREQTRFYRAAFDELGANGTVALRGESGFIDSESGEALLHDELDDPKQYIGMVSTVTGKTKWKTYSKAEKVYTVCERISCRGVQLSGTKVVIKIVRELFNLYKSQTISRINNENAAHNVHHLF